MSSFWSTLVDIYHLSPGDGQDVFYQGDCDAGVEALAERRAPTELGHKKDTETRLTRRCFRDVLLRGGRETDLCLVGHEDKRCFRIHSLSPY